MGRNKMVAVIRGGRVLGIRTRSGSTGRVRHYLPSGSAAEYVRTVCVGLVTRRTPGTSPARVTARLPDFPHDRAAHAGRPGGDLGRWHTATVGARPTPAHGAPRLSRAGIAP